MNAKIRFFVFCSMLAAAMLACTPTLSKRNNVPLPTTKSTKPTAAVATTIVQTRQELPSPTANNQPKVEFQINSSNQVAPEDVLEEIFYIAGSGGGAGICGFPPYYSTPTIVEDPQDTELMHWATMVTCGWSIGQTIETLVTFPDGRQVSSTVVVKAGTEVVLSFQSHLSDPDGIYQFEISGDGVELVSNAYFRKHTIHYGYELDEKQILFNNFLPAEKIQLFMYSCKILDAAMNVCSWRFGGWQEYEMDQNGSLIVNAPVKDNYFVALTPDGAEIPVFSPDRRKAGLEPINKSEGDSVLDSYSHGIPANREYFEYLECPANVPTKIGLLQLGKFPEVIFTGRSVAPFYANPRTTARKIAQLNNGEFLQILRLKPICVENKVWWLAYYPKDDSHPSLYGYIVEVDENGNQYLDLNIPAATPTVFICSGLPSRIEVGMDARIAFTDGSKMRIRAKPGISQEILNRIPEGTVVNILEGPQCVDGSTWWHVRTESGLEGWMVEYQGNTYLMEPVPK